MDPPDYHEGSKSRLSFTDGDEHINVTNPIVSQSSHAAPYNLETPPPHLSNLFPNNPNQSMPSNHFPMGYGFPSTNFNPHFQQTYSFQGLMNPSVFPFDTHAEAQFQKKSKRQKTSQKSHKKDLEPHQPVRRNWTREEDVALTKAWLHISIDPIIGTDQSNETLWKRIHPIWKEYLANDSLEDRPIGGLSKRWCTIQAAVNKFHGLYEQLERSPKSGTNLDDLKREAHRMFKEMSVDNKPFSFEHCWDECKKNAKWCIQLTSSNRQKTNNNSPPTSNTSASPTTNEPIAVGSTELNSVDANEIPRPLGRKNSKDKKKMQCQEKSMMDVFFKVQESVQQQYNCSQEELELKRETTLMMKKEYELKEQTMKKEVELKEKELIMQEKAQRRRNQQKILNQDLSKLAPAARAIMEKMQVRITKEWDEDDCGYI